MMAPKSRVSNVYRETEFGIIILIRIMNTRMIEEIRGHEGHIAAYQSGLERGKRLFKVR
jgi:hypothetical protein